MLKEPEILRWVLDFAHSLKKTALSYTVREMVRGSFFFLQSRSW